MFPNSKDELSNKNSNLFWLQAHITFKEHWEFEWCRSITSDGKPSGLQNGLSRQLFDKENACLHGFYIFYAVILKTFSFDFCDSSELHKCINLVEHLLWHPTSDRKKSSWQYIYIGLLLTLEMHFKTLRACWA